MSLKRELAKEIEGLENEIRILESKRMRSMAAVVEALASKTEPDEYELQYFRRYTADIDERRGKLIDLMVRLKHLT